MLVEVIKNSLEKKPFVRGEGVEMVNLQPGEFIIAELAERTRCYF